MQLPEVLLWGDRQSTNRKLGGMSMLTEETYALWSSPDQVAQSQAPIPFD